MAASLARSGGAARYLAIAVFVLLASLAVVAIVAGVRASDTPAAPGEGASPYDPGTCDSSSAIVQKADEIVASGNEDLYPVAKRLYRLAIRGAEPATSECAAQGLALLVQAEGQQADDAAADRTWAETLKEDWKAWSEKYSSALKDAALAAAAVLVVLLVLARLLTGVFVRPDAVAVPEGWRRVLWSVGLACLITACVSPLVAASLSSGQSWWWPVGIAAVGLAAVGLLAISNWWTSSTGWIRTLVTVAVAGVAGSLLAMPVIDLPILPALKVGWNGALVAGASVAAIGLALVCFARGLALVMQVQVTGSSGTDNASQARLLVGRLKTLGSAPPAELRTMDQSDITSLPDDALTAVPTGAIATAIFNVLRVARPAAPWRITATRPDDSCVVIAVSRNGRVVPEGAIVIGVGDIPGCVPKSDAIAKPTDDDKARAADELMTAVAAHVLSVLAYPRHPDLRKGMCGATEWRALAFHAIAQRPTTDASRKKTLLHASIDASPRYLLARMSLADTINGDNKEQRQSYGKELNDIWDAFSTELGADKDGLKPESGYEAAQLRLLFNRAVAAFNNRTDAAVEELKAEQEAKGTRGAPAGAQADATKRKRKYWRDSADAAIKLDTRLENLRNRKWHHTDLLDNATGPAKYLLLDLLSHQVLAEKPTIEALEERTKDYGVNALPPACTRDDFYGRACYLAGIHEGEGNRDEAIKRHDEALKALEVAASDPLIAEWATKDPSLAIFNDDHDEHGQEGTQEQLVSFRKLVTPAPPSSYLALPAFAPYAESLKAYGLPKLGDLLAVAPYDLARVAKVHDSVARRWLGIAALDERARRGGPVNETSLQILQVLISMGVTTIADLDREMTKQEDFYKRLIIAARRTRILPAKSDTIVKWGQPA